MKSKEQLEKELNEKNKALLFLKERYEEDTGKKLLMPSPFAKLLSNATP